MAYTPNFARGNYVYIGDDTDNYNLPLSFDNGTTINGGTATALPANPSKPSGMTPRHIYIKSTTTGQKKKVAFLSNTGFGAIVLGASYTVAGETWKVSGKIGEKLSSRS